MLGRFLGSTRRRSVAATRVLASAAAFVLVASGCGSDSDTSSTRAEADLRAGVLTAPPSLPLPPESPDLPIPTTPRTTLPEPAVIPVDSYADEPVIEIGTMEIPKIGLNHRIFRGVTLNNLDNGPSHWPGTAVPGQPGNTVFAGHRTTNGAPFLRLDELEPGDEVTFRVEGVRSTYHVTGGEIVGPEAVWIADQTADATGTLYACHPPGWATYRIVVKLALVSAVPDL